MKKFNIGGIMVKGKLCKKERNKFMWFYMLVLTVFNLLFVYKREYFASKVTAGATLWYYFTELWRNAVPLSILIKDGMITMNVFLWDIINIVSLILVLVFLFQKRRKAALWALWIRLVIVLLSNWNAWFNYILYLKNLFD